MKYSNIKGICIVLCFFVIASCAKPTPSEKSVNKDMDWNSVFTSQGLVNVTEVDSTILVNLRYSSTNNFTGKDVYGSLEEAYLQLEAVAKLSEASAHLQEINPELRLLIYDAARPRRIQQILWDVVDLPDSEKPGYVANPKTGSIHNYGCAIDLTISDKDGHELDMGTDYDNFTFKAHINDEETLLENGVLNETQVSNRRLLRKVMTSAGFETIESEWWHFDAFPRTEVVESYSIIE